MTPLQESDLLFLFALTQNIEWDKMDESTGVPSLSKTSVESVVKYVPSVPEQIAIGNFFRNLDEQITAQAHKIEQIKQLKAAYLQKMFI
jgi:type I restriction enzyme S subunit